MFSRIPANDIPAEWHRIGPLVEKALQVDPDASPDTMRRRLETGRCIALDVLLPNAAALIVIETIEDDGMVCWFHCLAGAIAGGPRQRLETIRATMATFANVAKNSGYRELRLCGRNWSRVFPDFTPHPAGERFELRKAL